MSYFWGGSPDDANVVRKKNFFAIILGLILVLSGSYVQIASAAETTETPPTPTDTTAETAAEEIDESPEGGVDAEGQDTSENSLPSNDPLETVAVPPSDENDSPNDGWSPC